ncbi:NtaA/DmoA family FMN-dependent monooxygenase [Amycolatopsis alba]|nr:NtaA/DmoA family FMN-dependent monooxygenase [Amycolatopsis alba]
MAEHRPYMKFNAFTMITPSHHGPGLAFEPGSRQLDYHLPQPWIDLAILLERGLFDTIFFADVLAPYEVFRGNRHATVAEGMQFPTGDPSVLIPLLAYHTQNLAFVFTSNILQAHPYEFARRVSTLDHLTSGRVGWNIVTSFLPGAGRNLGFGGLPEHPERYARAEEYTAAVYKLWEHSWEDGAAIRDTATRIFADPAKVHAVRHRGEFYDLDGPHLCEPSPQRTPLLFQAGMSPTGRAFAGRHAEALFINSLDPDAAAPVVADVRQAAVNAGRDPHNVKIFVPQSFLLAATEQEAHRRDKELLERQTIEGNAARMSVFLFHDWGTEDLTAKVADLRHRDVSAPVRKLLDWSTRDDWTLGELLLRWGNRRIVGTPEQIADTIERWHEAGVDGINLEYVTSPGSFGEFIEHVVPLLQKRGLMQREYLPGTLREKFFGDGPHLPGEHPARRHRAPGRSV